MTRSTDAQRLYRSPRRTAAAGATRARILGAATTLFVRDGFAGTSVRSIATAAGVAEKTVYLAFDTKLALLKEVVDATIVGDDAPAAAHERAWFREIVDATDPRDKLRLLARATRALHERTGPVFAMAQGAAAVDPGAAELWAQGKRGHRADMGRIARSFAEGALPTGRDTAWARSVLYVLVGPETWHLVRHELDQSADQYESWLRTTLWQSWGLPDSG